MLFHQENAPGHKSIVTIAKIHKLHFQLHPLSSYSPDLASSDCWLFADLKRMSYGKRFGDVISEIKMYVEAKDKSFYKKASKC